MEPCSKQPPGRGNLRRKTDLQVTKLRWKTNSFSFWRVEPRCRKCSYHAGKNRTFLDYRLSMKHHPSGNNTVTKLGNKRRLKFKQLWNKGKRGHRGRYGGPLPRGGWRYGGRSRWWTRKVVRLVRNYGTFIVTLCFFSVFFSPAPGRRQRQLGDGFFKFFLTRGF